MNAPVAAPRGSVGRLDEPPDRRQRADAGAAQIELQDKRASMSRTSASSASSAADAAVARTPSRSLRVARIAASVSRWGTLPQSTRPFQRSPAVVVGRSDSA
jgi:hypothetical protein